MKLDLSSLQDALTSLDRAIARAQADESDVDFRDVVIHRFEYTYELSWKMMKRQMQMDSPSSVEIDSLNFRDLFRHAHANGLIKDPDAWFVYRQQRNIALHTYDQHKAQ